MTWKHGFYSFLDYIFPLAEPLSGEDQEKPHRKLLADKAAIPKDDGHLTKYLTVCQDLLDKERERKQGVEARLTSILGLSSIAGTVAFGGFFLGSSGLSHIQSPLLRWLMIAAGCYLTLQICAAILAAIRGLSRKAYLSLTISDLTAGPEESDDVLSHRQAERTLEVLADHDAQNSAKLTQMAIAHCAMRNFLVGLLVFTVLAAISAARINASDELVDKLKQSHDLNELLRGPQGPPGIAGPKGDPGSAAVTCATTAKPRKKHVEQPCNAAQPSPTHQ
jgi:hypothetical protein